MLRSPDVKSGGRSSDNNSGTDDRKAVFKILTKLTQERLKQLLQYEPNTGVFTYKVARQGVVAGSVAGTADKKGYRKHRLDGSTYWGHRLAWLFVHGEWPQGEIDHLNGNRADNRIENLRDVDARSNHENRRVANKNNATGLLGAHFDKATGTYSASITVAGINIMLGRFDSAEAAHEAYLAAKRRLHAGCTI